MITSDANLDSITPYRSDIDLLCATDRRSDEDHRLGSKEMNFMEAGNPYWRLSSRSSSWRPPTDVFELEESIVVRVEIAGMREEDISIELDGRLLSIRGVRPDVPERRAYHQMEIRFGEFGVEVELPAVVDIEQAQAVYDNGFLRMILPKSLPRHIQVEEGEI
jgi:HSP20 family protein